MVSTCAPVLWTDSLHSFHLSDGYFLGFGCPLGATVIQVLHSTSLVSIRRSAFSFGLGTAIAVSASGSVVLEDIQVQNFTSLSNEVVAITGFSTGSLLLKNSTWEGNKASIGGALYLINLAACYISHSSFSHNFATNGGAIGVLCNLSAPASLSVTDTVFRGNQASGQGGVFYIFFDSPAALLAFSLQSTVIEDNVGKAGSGFYLASKVQLLPSSVLTNVNMTGNRAEVQGVLSLNHQNGTLTLTSVSFTNNTGQPGESCLFTSPTSSAFLFLHNSTFQGNIGTHTVHSAVHTTLTISNTLFQGNSGTSLYLKSTHFVCSNCSFRQNAGSEVVLITDSIVYLQFAVFDSNTASNSEAVIQVSDLTSLNCEDCVFFNNTAVDKGGTVQGEGNSVIRLRHCRFERNSVERQGSALSLIAAKAVFLSDCVFTSNRAGQGGTLFLTGTVMSLLNCSLDNNSAGLLINQSNVTLTGCEFAKQGKSSGYFLAITSLSDVLLEDTTLRQGESADIGAIYLEESNLLLKNCRVWGLTGNRGTLIYAFGFANLTLDHTSVTDCKSSLNELIYLLLSSGYRKSRWRPCPFLL